ncbi:hypothetical protein O988_08025, partial [Pseudogymnoascus sp. VKM F-3808]
ETTLARCPLSRAGLRKDEHGERYQAISQTTPQDLAERYDDARISATKHSAPVILHYLIARGVDVKPHQNPPRPLTDSQRGYQQILEKVAAWGSIETFELLRSKGAPLGWRPLHLAVEMVTYFRPSYMDDDEKHAGRMALVRHLIDVVGLDMNVPDQPAGSEVLPLRFGTPICYVAGSARRQGRVRDSKELTWLLLDRGADPMPTIERAKVDYPRFVEDVEAWKAKRGG